MVGDRFRLRYKLTPEDYQVYSGLALRRTGSGSWWNYLLPGAIFVAIVMVGLLMIINASDVVTSKDIRVAIVGIVVGALCTILGYVLVQRVVIRAMVGAHDTMIGNFRLTAYEGGGIQVTGTHMQSSFDWTAFTGLTQSSGILVLWVDTGIGMFVPVSAFSDDGEKHEFVDFVRERIEAHKRPKDVLAER